MIRFPRVMDGFDAVAWGQEAKQKLTAGQLINEMVIDGPTNPALIEHIKIEIDGDPVYYLTGEAVKFLERLDKRWEEDGKYVLTFTDNSMKPLGDQLMSGLYLPEGSQCFVKIKLSSAGIGPVSLGGEITTTEVARGTDEFYALTAFRPRVRMANFKGGPTGADGVKIKDLFAMNDGREILRGVHFDGRDGGANDYIANLKVERDRVTLWDRTKERCRNWLKRNERAPQDGWYHFYPVGAGFVTEALNTQHGFELNFVLTLSTAMTDVPAIIESLEQVGPTKRP